MDLGYDSIINWYKELKGVMNKMKEWKTELKWKYRSATKRVIFDGKIWTSWNITIHCCYIKGFQLYFDPSKFLQIMVSKNQRDRNSCIMPYGCKNNVMDMTLCPIVVLLRNKINVTYAVIKALPTTTTNMNQQTCIQACLRKSGYLMFHRKEKHCQYHLNRDVDL